MLGGRKVNQQDQSIHDAPRANAETEALGPGPSGTSIQPRFESGHDLSFLFSWLYPDWESEVELWELTPCAHRSALHKIPLGI